MISTSKLIIGIDPGEHNGIAMWTKSRGLTLHTFSFWETIDRIDGLADETAADQRKSAIKFIIENPNLNAFMYGRNTGYGNKADARIAQNTGMNKQDAKRIIQRLNSHGFDIEEVKPNPKSQKWSSDYFEKLYLANHSAPAPRSNEHNRDAAKLISQYWL